MNCQFEDRLWCSQELSKTHRGRERCHSYHRNKRLSIKTGCRVFFVLFLWSSVLTCNDLMQIMKILQDPHFVQGLPPNGEHRKRIIAWAQGRSTPPRKNSHSILRTLLQVHLRHGPLIPDSWARGSPEITEALNTRFPAIKVDFLQFLCCCLKSDHNLRTMAATGGNSEFSH